MKILHLSDIHYRREFGRRKEEAPGDESICGGYKAMVSAMENPLVFLDQCLAWAAGDMDKADLVVITGDLTEDGKAEDYRCLKRHIREKIGQVPLVVTLGNHDNKQSFREGWLEEAKGGAGTPYNTLHWLDGTAVISLDTSVQGAGDGHFSHRQSSWLESVLEEVGHRPSILVTHHHLLPEQGQIPPLPESRHLLSIIEKSSICCILCGHTHHHYAGMAAGRPLYIADSLSFCGDNIGGGKVCFQEKYGFSIYRIEEGMVRRCRSETFANGHILGTLTF